MTLPNDPERAGTALAELVKLMARLRVDCPWDRKQTLRDLAGYLLEESHEALEALRNEDLEDLEGELGDLLFQIVFLACLGAEKDAFTFESIASRIHAKLVARHPHVFGESQVDDAAGVKVQWEELKRKERAARGAASPFDGLPRSLPALLTASRLTSRAADLGFDWEKNEDVVAKLDEEVSEFRVEVLRPEPSKDRIAEEVGDILFTVVNVARRLQIDPEDALARTNAKFRRRFESVSARVESEGRRVRDTPLAELDAHWDAVKADETSTTPKK